MAFWTRALCSAVRGVAGSNLACFLASAATTVRQSTRLVIHNLRKVISRLLNIFLFFHNNDVANISVWVSPKLCKLERNVNQRGMVDCLPILHGRLEADLFRNSLRLLIQSM